MAIRLPRMLRMLASDASSVTVRIMRMVLAERDVPRMRAGVSICARFPKGLGKGDVDQRGRPSPPDRGEDHDHGADPERGRRQHQDRQGAHEIVAGRVLSQGEKRRPALMSFCDSIMSMTSPGIIRTVANTIRLAKMRVRMSASWRRSV